MATMTWGKPGEAFAWGNWWDFSGIDTAFVPQVPPTGVPLQVRRPFVHIMPVVVVAPVFSV